MGFGNNFEETNKIEKNDTKKDTEQKHVGSGEKIMNLKQEVEKKLTTFSQKDREQYKLNKSELLEKQANFQKLSPKTKESYIFCLFYIDQLAQSKTRAEVSPEERQFFLDFQSMNESLGIDYQLPVFKESHEKQSIHTMADIYHHTDALVQDPGAGFQEYINSNYGLFDTKEPVYDKNILQDRDFWVQQEQERQQKYPDWFDQQTQSIDRQKVDQEARPIVEGKYKQALQYGQNFVTNLDQGIQKMQKDYILSFVLREFSKLFMTISTYDAGHFGNDFSLDKIQSTTNGTVRLEGRLSGRKMGMDYSLATGELRVDDFLYQQFPGGNFSIDPASPGKYKLNGTLASFDTEYKDKPPIDLTNIIQKNTDPKTIQDLAQEHTKLLLDKHYKSSHNAEFQSQVIAMVEKNKIVQDWLKLFVPGAVESVYKFDGVNNTAEIEFRNMLQIRYNTINNVEPGRLAYIGNAMDRLAGFCQQLQSNETIRKNFQTGRTDTVIKDKLLGLSREIHTLDTTQRGKAFAALCGNPQGGLLVQDGRLQADDIYKLVDMCEDNKAVEDTDFSLNFTHTFYDTSIDGQTV